MADKRIPLQVKDLTGDLQTLSGYVVALRSGTFASNTIVGTEAAEDPGYYDFTDILPNVAYQLWAGTSASTMTRNTAFSGEDGAVIYGIDDAALLDPADFEDNQIIVKTTISTVEQFIPIDIMDLLDDVGYASSIDYILRGKLIQDNSVQSGKAFFGTYTIEPSDGTLIDGTSTTLSGARLITIAGRCLRSASAKISTGIYSVQCQVLSGASYVNGFITGVNGSANRNSFFPYIQEVWGTWTPTERGTYDWIDVYTPELKGYLILDVNHDESTYYDTGKLIFKTYNTSWVLTDDIINRGININIRFPIGGI